MLLKIKGKNQEMFEETVTKVMNIACVAFRKGSIPTEEDMQEPQRTALYWYKNIPDNRFELFQQSNNHHAFIKESGENFIVIQFHSRRDSDGVQVTSLSNLIVSLFDEVELVS